MSDNNAEVVIGGNSSEAVKAIESLHSATKQGFAGIKDSLSSLTGVFESVSKGFALVTTVLAGGKAFKESVDTVVELTTASKKLGMQLGVGTSDASRISFAMKELNVDTNLVGMASQRIAMQVARGGQAFQKMGVDTKDANGNLRNSFDIMMDVNEKLKGFKEGTDRNAEGVRLYGRAWSSLSGLLKASKGDIEDKEKEAQSLNLVISQENVEAVEAYKRSMNSASAVMEGVFKTIGEYVMPGLTEMANWFRSIGPTAIAVTRAVMEAFINVIGYLADAAVALWNGLKEVFAAIGDIITDCFGQSGEPFTAMEFFRNCLKVVEIAFIGLEVGIKIAVQLIVGYIMSFIDYLKMLAAVAVAAMHLDWSGIKDAWKDGLKTIEDEAAKRMANIVKIAEEGAKKMADAATDNLGKTPETHDRKLKEGGENANNVSKKSKKEPDDGAMAVVKARLNAELALLKESLSEEQSANEDAHANFLMSDEQYYDAKRAIASAGLQEEEKRLLGELEALKGKSATTAKEKNALDAQTLAMQGQLSVVRMKEVGDIEAINRAQANADKTKNKARVSDAISTEKEMTEIGIDGQTEYYQNLLDLGQINAVQMLQIKLDLEQKKYEADLLALQRTRDLNNLNVEEQRKIDSKIEILNAQHALKMVAANNAITKEEVKDWKTGMTSIQNSFSSAFQGMLNGTMTFKKGLQTIFTGIWQSFSKMVSEKVATWIMGETKMADITKAFSAIKTALFGTEAVASVTADQTKVASTSVSTGEEIACVAPVAGGKAFSAMADIPYIGPILGAAAMAAAIAMIMGARHSAEGGFDVPSGVNPMTQLHQKEMVLPAKHADVIRSIADGGGGAGGGVHMHVHTQSTQDFQQFLKRNSQTVAPALRRLARNLTPVGAV